MGSICLYLSNATATNITLYGHGQQGQTNGDELVSMGLALKKEKKHSRFTANVKEYLTAIFEEDKEGKQTRKLILQMLLET